MWDFLAKTVQAGSPLDRSKCVYVGDAAGVDGLNPVQKIQTVFFKVCSIFSDTGLNPAFLSAQWSAIYFESLDLGCLYF